MNHSMGSMLPRLRPSPKAEAAAVDAWNKQHPVGAAVKYFPVSGRPEFVRTTTRSAAWLLGGHTAVVSTEAAAGCALRNLQPDPESEVEA